MSTNDLSMLKGKLTNLKSPTSSPVNLPTPPPEPVKEPEPKTPVIKKTVEADNGMNYLSNKGQQALSFFLQKK